MKVILLKDVAKIGRRADVVNVPDGYALNKLIPQNMAQPATPANIKRIAKQKAVNQSNNDEILAKITGFVEEIKESPLEIKMEANDLGHLFKSVNGKDIQTAASERNMDIPEQFVNLTSPIKEVGEHEVDIIVQGQNLKLAIKVTAK